MSWYNDYTEAEVGQAIANALAGGSSLIHQASRTLTHAELTSWQSQDLHQYVIVPGAGISRFALFNFGVLRFHRSATPYANVSNGSSISFTEFSGSSASLSFNWQAAGLLTALVAFDQMMRFSGEDHAGENTDLSGSENKPIALLSTNPAGNFTGGDSSDYLTVCCSFEVFDSDLGRFLTTTESGWNETTRTFT